MSDLVQTLRDMVYPCCEEAADEIERLRLEGMRMSSMLWDIHAICNNWNYFPFYFVKSIQRRARYGLGCPDVEKL